MAAPGLARAQRPPPVAAPTIDSVTRGDESLIVDWTAPARIDAAEISAYDLRSIESDAPDKAAGLWTVVLDAWSAGDLLYLLSGLTNDTQYDVQVRAVTMDGEGSWSATVTGTPADHSGATAGATALALDSTATGVIESGDDEDFFKIVLSSAADLWLYTTSNLDTKGALYDSGGGHLKTHKGGGGWPGQLWDFEIRAELEAGTYYVSVGVNHSKVTGPYTLHARTATAPGGSLADATTITLGAPAPGRIDAADDRDFFKIVLTSAADLWIVSSGSMDLVGQLLDADGVVIAENDDSSLAYSRYNFGIWREVEAGTYYIRVRALVYGWAIETYTLHARTLTPPGGSIAGAVDIDLLQTPARLDSAADEHYFVLTIDADEYLYMDAVVGHTLFRPNDPASLAAEVFDQDGNPVDIYQIPHSAYIEDGRSFVSFAILGKLSAGTNYLRIWSPSGKPGPYLLTIFDDTAYTSFINECIALETPVSDPLYGCQWHLRNSGQYPGGAGQDINVEDVWTTTRGAGVNVAVVDDGLHFEHEDLTDNADPARNRNYSSRADIFNPFEFHGTRVAGLIAARDNSIGMRGVAPQATIYGYNLLADSTAANAADAMFRIGEGSTTGDEDTAVSNNSWGPSHFFGPAPASAAWELAVQNGVTSGDHGKGIFYVFSVGNGGTFTSANLNGYANYYAVTAVCSVNYDDQRSSYSELGANLWVCAPSNEVVADLPAIATTDNGHQYTPNFGGTSAAAPIVSGVAALLRSADDSLTWRDLKLILAASARKNDGMNAGWAQGALEYGSDSERYFFNHKYGLAWWTPGPPSLWPATGPTCRRCARSARNRPTRTWRFPTVPSMAPRSRSAAA